MQVILLEKIANVGSLGDVVKVKDGYARNFLIPQGKAKRATPENIKLLEGQRAELEKIAAEKLERAQTMVEKLEGLTVQIVQRAGVDGRLFGSVTSIDIVEALKGHGFELERAMVRLPNGPLKQTGDHPITLQLHTDAAVAVVISVLGETTN
jgi:ribosomal protein L9